MTLERPLTGITVPLATPLLDPGTLDISGLEGLVAHVIRGSVHAIFVLGTTGEGPCLTVQQRRAVVEHVCRNAGNTPVLVGITDSSMGEALAMAEFSASKGAAAVVYAGPTYSPISQPELIAHVSRLADVLPLPVFLYNMTSHTKVVFDPSTVAKLSTHKNVLGLKDSSGSLPYFQAVRNAAPDCSLLMGPEELLLPAMMCGASGGVNGGANLYPRLYVALYQAACAGNYTEAKALQDKVLMVSRGIYGHGTYSSSYLKGLKYALSTMGFGSGALSEPYMGFTGDEGKRIDASMRLFANF
jgi:dihydrodipicolinate synthase/N-acetylneuraminate lyase